MGRITQALRDAARREAGLVAMDEGEFARLCDQVDAVDANLAAEARRLRGELARAQGKRGSRRLRGELTGDDLAQMVAWLYDHAIGGAR